MVVGDEIGRVAEGDGLSVGALGQYKTVILV